MKNNLKVILTTNKLYKCYHELQSNSVEVINKVDLSINSGEFYAVMGKSGCGKTTLLKLLGSIEKATSGSICFKGKDINIMSLDEIAAYRRGNIGFIFQDFRLLKNVTVMENIILPLLLDEVTPLIAEKKVKDICEKIGISKLLTRYPDQLSGGEKQRVAICRVLINEPEIILADEPTGNRF